MSPEHDLIGTESQKIYPVEEIASFVAEAKAQGKTTGLIVGCFDILHKGHVDCLRQAKKYVDVLIVGVDRDETVKLKGSGRPVNDLGSRCEVLAELINVDLIFPIPFILPEYTASLENVSMFESLTRVIKPDYLITNQIADDFWQEKASRAKRLGIGYLGLEIERPTSSSKIAEQVQKEI